jgi:hypothetical protein
VAEQLGASGAGASQISYAITEPGSMETRIALITGAPADQPEPFAPVVPLCQLAWRNSRPSTRFLSDFRFQGLPFSFR